MIEGKVNMWNQECGNQENGQNDFSTQFYLTAYTTPIN